MVVIRNGRRRIGDADVTPLRTWRPGTARRRRMCLLLEGGR
jgi:hypothetical protein